MSEDEAELTHYPGPSRTLHSQEHSRARTRSAPPAPRRLDTNSNLNENSYPPMRAAAHEQDDATVWWCSLKRRKPQTPTPAITPDACPLCPPSDKLRIKTVADVISHCRRVHKTLPTRSDGIDIETMQAFRAQYGYLYWNSHIRYIGVSERHALPDGMRPFTYKKCDLCPTVTPPPVFRPMHPSQLVYDSNPVLEPDNTPHPPPTTEHSDILADTMKHFASCQV